MTINIKCLIYYNLKKMTSGGRNVNDFLVFHLSTQILFSEEFYGIHNF